MARLPKPHYRDRQKGRKVASHRPSTHSNVFGMDPAAIVEAGEQYEYHVHRRMTEDAHNRLQLKAQAKRRRHSR